MRSLPVLLALPLLLAAVGHDREHAETKRFRLELVVLASQHGTYVSAWNPGDVISDHDASDKRPVTYHRAFHWFDDCEWESIEELVPTAADHYASNYREHAVSCPDGGSPDNSMQRSGTITVIPTSADLPTTPLRARVSF
jgi:hypothetical protein